MCLAIVYPSTICSFARLDKEEGVDKDTALLIADGDTT